MKEESSMEALAPAIAIAPPFALLDERTNDEPVTFNTAPFNTLMLPPSSTEVHATKFEFEIDSSAPWPEACIAADEKALQSVKMESEIQALEPTMAIAPPLAKLSKRMNDEPVTFNTAPFNTLMLPPSSTEVHATNFEFEIDSLAPWPETCSVADEKVLLLHDTVTCSKVTPVQPEAESQEIWLLARRLIALGELGSPTTVREHGNHGREHRSTRQSHSKTSTNRMASWS